MLKKENWFICFIMMIFTFGGYIFILASQLNLFKKDKWYSNYKYWLYGTLALIFPVFVMLIVLVIEMTVEVAKKLKIDGSDIYGNPYVWIGLLIIPVIGWIFFLVMYIYLQFYIVINIKKGLK